MYFWHFNLKHILNSKRELPTPWVPPSERKRPKMQLTVTQALAKGMGPGCSSQSHVPQQVTAKEASSMTVSPKECLWAKQKGRIGNWALRMQEDEA